MDEPLAPEIAAGKAGLLALPEVARCVDDARPYQAGKAIDNALIAEMQTKQS